MSRYALPISNRPIPREAVFIQERYFLAEASINSLKTGTTYRSGLRLFADWLQQFRRDGFLLTDSWPLDPAGLTNQTVIDFRHWLLNNRSRATTTTYMAAVMEYLIYLESRDCLPSGISLSRLQRQLGRHKKRNNQAANVVHCDIARQDMPRIVAYYDSLPLPPTNDGYNRQLAILRDRAIMNVLYSTGARISEIVSLDRSAVRNGHSSTAMIVGKGNKSRTLFIQPYAQEAVRAYLAERQDSNPALFLSHSRNSKNTRLTITSVHNAIKKAVRELGLEPSLSAHDFRHFQATKLARKGMPLEVVQEYLGHANINTTRNVYVPVLGMPVVLGWLEKADESPAERLRLMEENGASDPSDQ